MSRWFRAMRGCVAVGLAGGGFLHVHAAGRPNAGTPAVSLEPAHAQTPFAAAAVSPQHAVIHKYCVTCHNERLSTAGLAFDKMDVGHVGDDAQMWEQVVRKLRARSMPPASAPRPDQATYQDLISWLETELDRAAAATPNPGRPSVHRLNRVEYGNAIRDLFALEVDSRSLLPADEDYKGFDNIADVLSVSPTLLERYVAVARRISQLVVADAAIRPTFETYSVHAGLIQDHRTSDELPFGSGGGIAIRHYFPLDGEYRIQVRLQRQLYRYIRGLGQPHQLDLRVDGERVGVLTVGRNWEKGKPPPMSYAGEAIGDGAWEDYAHHADEGLEARFSAKAGTRVVSVSFDEKVALPEGVLEVPINRSSFAFAVDEMQNASPSVSSVAIGGPFEVHGLSDTPSRRKVFVCRPAGGRADEEERCARKILVTLARRAYRRPVTERDVRTLLSFYETGRRAGGFDAGIQAALERILVGPEFLFRIERDPPGVALETAYRLSDLELASRLSFFLWSSIPDDELLDVAGRRKLRDPAVLERQVRRMLADARSTALVSNFAAQWLELRKMRNVAPDEGLFPEFDENLREAMQRETELFLISQVREDRSVVDLLRAKYTFVNERLALHYGIPNIYGPNFRRVTFDDDRRGGLLGQASLLTVTSYGNRTSPVLRGKWLLDKLLGAPPPPPPPNVPALQERGESTKLSSVRERLEEHRKNPVCASCHKVIDPPGFALENFDAIGRWRTRDETNIPFETGDPIDASGVMPDGAQFEGPAGLRQLVLSRQEEFVQTVVENLLTYALGRGLGYYDMPTVRHIKRATTASDYRWSSIVLSIVNSTPFQMRRSQP